MRSPAILASSIRDIGASRAPFSAASDWEKNSSHAWRLRSPSAICAVVHSGGSPRFTGHHLTGRLTLLRLRATAHSHSTAAAFSSVTRTVREPTRGRVTLRTGAAGRAVPGGAKPALDGFPTRVPVPAAPAVVEHRAIPDVDAHDVAAWDDPRIAPWIPQECGRHRVTLIGQVPVVGLGQRHA